MNDILSDLNPSKYKLKSNNNQSNSIQNNTTNATKGDLLADLNSGKYKLKGSETKEITQTESTKKAEVTNTPAQALNKTLKNMQSAYETHKVEEGAKLVNQAQNLMNTQQDKILKGTGNLTDYAKTLTPEKTQEIKATSAVLNPQLLEKKNPDAKYYFGKFAQGTNEALENAVDETIALNSNLGIAQNKAIQNITSLGGLVPNKISEYAKGQAEKHQQVKEDVYSKDFLPTKDLAETLEYEYAPNKMEALAGDVLSGVGGMLPTIATNLLAPGAGYVTLGLQGAGGGTKQAYNETGNLGAAQEIYGALSGLAEIAVEKLSGGIGGLGNGAVDNIAAKLIKNGFIRNATGEGIEEAITTFIDPYLQRLTYNKGAEGAKASEILRSALIGSLTSMLLQGGSSAINLPQNIQQSKQNRQELRNSLEGIEKMLPTYESQAETATSQENVARELPTMDSQQDMLPTNRIEGQMVQTGNMKQMAGNEEKVSQFSKKAGVAGEKPAFSMPEIPKGYTRLYRGLTQEYNKNYDKNKLDNSNGYESWTDSYDLAKAYGDNVYYIDIPTNEIKNDIIDNDSTSETYGDRNLIYFNDKPVGIKGQSGKEYMLYTDHENYPNLEYKSVQTNLNNLENQQEIGYNGIARKPEPKNYVYKRINNSDKARISSDYMVNANKYTEDIGSVDFSDVSYIYQKKNNEIEILKKFKGSQEFINSIKGEWSNGTNEMPERNNKVNESVRDERRQSNIANGGTRRTRESGTSNRPDSRLGGQRGDINGEQVGKNNSDGIKGSEKSSFSMPKNDVQAFASSESSKPYMDLDRYTSRDNESKVNKVGLTDIQNAINDIVTVKTGKFRQNAYGIYKTKGEIIRLKQMKDIPVALHELTHHLDKKYNLSSSDKAFNELKKIAVVGENATNQTIISEGVAEFGRYYMTDKEYAKEIAPYYYDTFEKALDGDPTMKAKVENIRQMVTNYLDQSPLNRLSSNIDYGDEDVSLWQKGKDTIIKTANTFRKNFVDDLDPLKKIVNEISGDKKLMTEEDAYKLLRLNNGVTGKVQVALEYGVLDKKGEKVSKSLKEILEPVANNQKEFVAYLTALRANDLQNRGIESGMLSRDVNDVIKMYKGNETFNNAAKELYNFQNKILETTLIDSGIITKDALDAYNKNNPHYVPFYRVMDENFKQSKSSKAKKPTKIKGSTRDIINPLESIIKNTYSYMQMAERNDTFKVLFDMANKYDGTGKWFDKVPTDMMATKVTAEDVKGILEQLNLGDEDVNYNEIFTTLFSPANNQKGNIVTVMQKGKPVHYEIMDKELFDILSPEIKSDNKLAKLLQFPAKTLRVGATHTPEFILRNPIRDTIDASIYSRNDFKPFIDTLIGIFDVAGRTDLYYKWLQSGGSGSTYTNAQRPVLQKTLKGLTEGVTNEKGGKKLLKGVGNLVKHPLRTYLDVAGTISNVAEEGTRVGEFRRALKKGKNEKEAALDSREITLDFSRGGDISKSINKYVAFFNAEVQGLDKMFTNFKDRPIATTIKAFMKLSLPAMIIRAFQDEDELDKVPQWEKDEFFVFFVNGTPIKIPKSQGLGQLFATTAERAIDYIRTKDAEAFNGLMQRLITSYVPIDSTTSILPNSFMPLIEIAMGEGGYSVFKQQPIVKQSLQNRSPKYQYDENTSTIAKTLGKLADNIPFVEGGISPKKIDHLISGYFGNLGKDAANLIGIPIDLLSGKKKDNEYKSLNSKLKKVPLLKGFIASDYASKSLDKFYKSKEEVNTKYTDAKFNISDGQTTATEKSELKYYKELNSLYNKAYNEIKELDEQIDAVTNGKGNDKYKETKIEQLKEKKDSIADKVEKQKELKGFNVKFNK